MSSTGQIVGGIVGAAVGFFAGGNVVVGAQIGMMIGGAIDPPDGPVINGPRLDDLSVQTATYGAFIPRDYGTIAQTGNIFWVKGDALTETPRAEESGGKGGPTSTTNLWDYSATFALGLCDCSDGTPIDGIRRIWINGQLFYDAGSNDIATIIASNEGASMFTLYSGSDTQLPDPLMQADKGSANVPAYRGLAYIVFEDLPLAKYNNSLAGAQIKVEIVKNGTIEGWLRRVTNTDTTLDFSTAYVAGVGTPYINSVSDGVVSIGLVNSTTQYSLDLNGMLLGASSAPIPVLAVSWPYYPCGRLEGLHLYVNSTVTSASGVVLCYEEISGGAAGSGPRIDASLPTDRYIYGVSIANDGNSVLIFMSDVGVSGAGVDMVDALWYELDSDGAVIRNGSVLSGPTNSYKIHLSRATVDHFGASSYDQRNDKIAHAYGAGLGTVSIYEIGDDDIIREAASPGYLSENLATHPSVYFDSNIIYAVSADDFNIFTSGLISDSTVTLASIVEAECLTSSLLTAGDLDVTELTDSVRGYRIASLGALRGGIEPLRAAWPFDVVQHGYQIKFKRRGSSSVATITADELDARAAGEAPGIQITNSREMDTLLPSKLLLKYIDATREYDTNEQPSDRGL